MKHKKVSWLILLTAIATIYFFVVALAAYDLRHSEAYTIGRSAAAAHFGTYDESVKLNWWNHVSFSEGSTSGGARFSLCASNEICVEVIVKKRSGRWVLERIVDQE